MKNLNTTSSQAFFAHFVKFTTNKGEVHESALKYFKAMDSQFKLFEYNDSKIYFTDIDTEVRHYLDPIRLLLLIKPINGKFSVFQSIAFNKGGADSIFLALDSDKTSKVLTAEEFKQSKLKALTVENLTELINSATSIKDIKAALKEQALSDEDMIIYNEMVDTEAKIKVQIAWLIDNGLAVDESSALKIINLPKL